MKRMCINKQAPGRKSGRHTKAEQARLNSNKVCTCSNVNTQHLGHFSSAIEVQHHVGTSTTIPFLAHETTTLNPTNEILNPSGSIQLGENINSGQVDSAYACRPFQCSLGGVLSKLRHKPFLHPQLKKNSAKNTSGENIILSSNTQLSKHS